MAGQPGGLFRPGGHVFTVTEWRATPLQWPPGLAHSRTLRDAEVRLGGTEVSVNVVVQRRGSVIFAPGTGLPFPTPWKTDTVLSAFLVHSADELPEWASSLLVAGPSAPSPPPTATTHATDDHPG